MKKLLFIFMSVLTFSIIGCTNGSTKSSKTDDSTVVDTATVDTVDTITTTAHYDSIMALIN